MAEPAITIDGLNVSIETREVFAALLRGGVTAVHWTCCTWEGFDATMRNFAQWKQRFVDHADIITQVYTAADIGWAARNGRLGIYLGWQNSSACDEYLPFLALFAELGLRVVQLTYNTANAVGAGCYETNDRGLTDFGHDLIGELNRLGIVIDLSHAGPNTAADAVRASSRPVCYSHVLPAAFNPHPRNKTDEQLRQIAERGGFVGATLFPAFLPRGYGSTIEDYLDAVQHLIDVVGEEQVGIGTDFMEGRDAQFFDRISRDKGYGRSLVDLGPGTFPESFGRQEDLFPELARRMRARRWQADRCRRILGGNWLRFLEDAWKAPDGATAARAVTHNER